jgi:pimeloyl-ACP methyl ester carboxylesterase
MNYIIVQLIGAFWSIFVIFRIIVASFKHGLKYFSNNYYVPYPKSLYSSEYQHHFAPLNNGINLHYVSCGKKSGPLLLLVHGFPEFWYSWRHQMSFFKKNFHVVAVDQRGYGLSDKPQTIADYRTNKLTEDLYHLLNHLGVARCHLAGHDWGGAVCWRFAQAYPQMVERLVILNCPQPGAFKSFVEGNFGQFLKSWYMFFFQLPYLPEWFHSRLNGQLIVDYFTKPPFGTRLTKFTEEEMEAFRANFSIPGSMTAAVNYYRAAFRYPEQPITTKPGNIYPPTLPCLLIWGDQDAALSVELAQKSKEFCPQLQVQIVPGASHWVQQDAPEIVNKAMENFFNEPLPTI